MQVVFRQRGTGSNYTVAPPPGRIWVDRFTRQAVGGPGAATIKVSGSSRDLLEYLSWLMVKVEIWNDIGAAVWWGYIGRVEIEYRRVRISADVEPMANRVAVAYTLTSLGQASAGERGTTDWSEDANSIKTFGIKELLLSLSDTTAAAANDYRDRALSDLKSAQAGYEIRQEPNVIDLIGEIDQPATATLYCFGWWSTLAWRYVNVATLLALQFETIGSLAQAVGDATTTSIAQAFDAGAAINLQQIGVYVKTVGAPADNLKISIYSNPDDLNPTTELDSQTISGASLTSSYAWVIVTLAAPYALTAGTSYFLVLSRSGAQDAVNHYSVLLDENQGYGAGPFVIYVGGAWAAYAGDMPFRLYDNSLVDTGQQAKSLITAYGQYLQQVRLVAASGVTTESYRDGDSNARYETEKILESGTSNNRRMLATVALDRTVSLYEQPASTTRPYQVDSLGKIYDPDGNPIRGDLCPAGVWMRPRDLPVIQAEFLSGLQAFFVESIEYDAGTDGLSWQPANLPDPWDQGVKRG